MFRESKSFAPTFQVAAANQTSNKPADAFICPKPLTKNFDSFKEPSTVHINLPDGMRSYNMHTILALADDKVFVKSDLTASDRFLVCDTKASSWTQYEYQYQKKGKSTIVAGFKPIEMEIQQGYSGGWLASTRDYIVIRQYADNRNLLIKKNLSILSQNTSFYFNYYNLVELNNTQFVAIHWIGLLSHALAVIYVFPKKDLVKLFSTISPETVGRVQIPGANDFPPYLVIPKPNIIAACMGSTILHPIKTKVSIIAYDEKQTVKCQRIYDFQMHPQMSYMTAIGNNTLLVCQHDHENNRVLLNTFNFDHDAKNQEPTFAILNWRHPIVRAERREADCVIILSARVSFDPAIPLKRNDTETDLATEDAKESLDTVSNAAAASLPNDAKTIPAPELNVTEENHYRLLALNPRSKLFYEFSRSSMLPQFSFLSKNRVCYVTRDQKVDRLAIAAVEDPDNLTRDKMLTALSNSLNLYLIKELIALITDYTGYGLEVRPLSIFTNRFGIEVIPNQTEQQQPEKIKESCSIQ